MPSSNVEVLSRRIRTLSDLTIAARMEELILGETDPTGYHVASLTLYPDSSLVLMVTGQPHFYRVLDFGYIAVTAVALNEMERYRDRFGHDKTGMDMYYKHYVLGKLPLAELDELGIDNFNHHLWGYDPNNVTSLLRFVRQHDCPMDVLDEFYTRHAGRYSSSEWWRFEDALAEHLTTLGAEPSNSA